MVMKSSAGFEAWLETTNDRRPLSDYKTVLQGTLAQMKELEGEPCSIDGKQPALLVDAKEKGTYWLCAACMFEKTIEKMELETKLEDLWEEFNDFVQVIQEHTFKWERLEADLEVITLTYPLGFRDRMRVALEKAEDAIEARGK